VQVRNTEAERQARLRAFDKQPVLAIEPQSTQKETQDTIKPKTPQAAAETPSAALKGSQVIA
jgi:hypothetical protein